MSAAKSKEVPKEETMLTIAHFAVSVLSQKIYNHTLLFFISLYAAKRFNSQELI
jgi:hypothetical protein